MKTIHLMVVWDAVEHGTKTCHHGVHSLLGVEVCGLYVQSAQNVQALQLSAVRLCQGGGCLGSISNQKHFTTQSCGVLDVETLAHWLSS